MKFQSFVLPLALLTAAACGASNDAASKPPAVLGPMPPAVATFFDDFHASRYSLAARDAKTLDDAAAVEPYDAPVSFVRALAHVWHANESGRASNPNPAEIAAEQRVSLELLATAKANNPNDPRVDCFLGLHRVAAGRATGNQALVKQGIASLDAAVLAWPQFSLFCRASAYDTLPASDPDYAKAVAAAYDTLDSCVGEKIDRDNPDITKYLGRATDTGPDRACWNDWIAPHNAEGFSLYFGDLLVKQGKLAVAKIVYNNAKLIKEYPTWPYKSLLDDRLGSDLAAKAALYRDADPANDPPIAGDSTSHACTYCHASSAVE